MFTIVEVGGSCNWPSGRVAWAEQSCDTEFCQSTMSLQEIYDEAMFEFSRGEFDGAIAKFEKILAEEPGHFDAQLSLSMAFYRKGDYARAIEEGHKAEKLKPHEQFVHTNLSLFYMKAGDKKTAEHHGLRAGIAVGRRERARGQAGHPASANPVWNLANPPPPPPKPVKLPEMPWKKNKAINPGERRSQTAATEAPSLPDASGGQPDADMGKKSGGSPAPSGESGAEKKEGPQNNG